MSGAQEQASIVLQGLGKLRSDLLYAANPAGEGVDAALAVPELLEHADSDIPVHTQYTGPDARFIPIRETGPQILLCAAASTGGRPAEQNTGPFSQLQGNRQRKASDAEFNGFQ